MKKKNKESIIVLRNGIYPHDMIYIGISIIIQLFIFYYIRDTGLIILLQFVVNGYLIPILKWRFHSHMIYYIIYIVVMTLMRFFCLCLACDQISTSWSCSKNIHMKYELLIIIIIVTITIYIVVISILQIFIMVDIFSCFNFIQYYLIIVFR